MSTKEKMLLAASEEFSINGYPATTTRNICNRADVNIAAVNYHFRNKEGIYKSVVDYLFDKTSSETVSKTIVSTEAEWKKELFSWVLDILTSASNPSSLSRWKNNILFREILDPSEVFPEIFKKYFKPYFSSIEYYVRCGVSADTSKEQIYIIIFSILSQSLFYGQNKVIVQQLFKSNFIKKENQMKEIATYITNGACSRLKFRKTAI